MAFVPDLEVAQISRVAASRAAAFAVLAQPVKAASLFLVIVIVLSTAFTFGLGALRSETVIRAVLGAVAGGALALAAIAYGELRRLRLEVDALKKLAP